MNNDQNEFRSTNELGVFYVFSRNHEKLGFMTIVEIRPNSSPDIIAITKDGKQVGIELEYWAMGAFKHYRVLSKKEQEATEGFAEFDNEKKVYSRGKWTRDESLWKFVRNGKTLLTKEDPTNQFWLDESTGCLLYKTVKTIGIDIILYWERDDRFRFWEFDKEVKTIDLQEELARTDRQPGRL